MFRSTRNPKKGWTAQRKVVMFSLVFIIYFYLAILAKSSCSSFKAWSISARGGEALVVQSSTFSRCCHPFGCPGYTVRKFASSSAWWCAGSTSGADLVKFWSADQYQHFQIRSAEFMILQTFWMFDTNVSWWMIGEISWCWCWMILPELVVFDGHDCSQKVVNVPFPSVAPLCKCCVCGY